MYLLDRILSLLLLTLFSGCLVSEVTEYSLTLNSDGISGTFTTIMRSVESDSPDSAAQQEDFLTLVENWKGDKYLLDQMDKGLYLKERKLFLDKGKLVWRESSIFADVTKLLPGYHPDDTLKFPVTDTTGLTIMTNGRHVTMRDSMFIVWPPHTRTFEMKSIRRAFTPESRFARLFRAYMKKR